MIKTKNSYRLLLLSLLAAFMVFFIKLVIRPLVVENNINDFGFHEFSPNLFYTIGMCLFAAFWVKKGQIKTMIFVTIGILIYETEQIWTSRTFDYLDIIATIVGLGISVLIVSGKAKKCDNSVKNEIIA